MKWIGLTGGIATGKSTVAKILRDLGLPVVDADSLAREVTKIGSVGLKSVVSAFGTNILSATGELDRKKLGQIVFASEEMRIQLENILHPLIQAERAKERRALEQNGCELAFYDVPLLFEKNMKDEFDKVVLVYANEQEQRNRLRERNGYSEEEISARLKTQIPIDDKVKLADYVIFNNDSLPQLKANLLTVLQELKV